MPDLKCTLKVIYSPDLHDYLTHHKQGRFWGVTAFLSQAFWYLFISGHQTQSNEVLMNHFGSLKYA